MGIVHATEFLLNLPDGLKDRSIQLFSLTDEGPSEFNIVVARERPRAGEALERFAERAHSALVARLPGFLMERRELIRIDKEPAILVDYTWQSPEGKMFQRQAIVHARGPNLMLLITATCREKLSARWEAMWGDFIAGFRLRAT